MLNKNYLKEQIKAEANNLGFCVIGFSSPAPLTIDSYKNWLNNYNHANMNYLATDEAVDVRQNPGSIFPECKTIISLGALYPNPSAVPQQTLPATSGKIAHYAVGPDYHLLLNRKIEELMNQIKSTYDSEIEWMSAVDTKPVAERTLANRAGLGWIAKNGMLTNPTYGSALFLCEIFINAELPPDEPFQKDFCGSCTMCIEACPTNCILPNRTIDANKCISYLTIEHRGVIHEDFFDAINPSIFGCDICLQVCPWNKKAKSSPMMAEFVFANHKTQFDISANLTNIINSFHRYFANSAIRRAGKQGFLRNCMIRLAQNPTIENMEMIDSIVSKMADTYLPLQRKKIINHLKKKKGS